MESMQWRFLGFLLRCLNSLRVRHPFIFFVCPTTGGAVERQTLTQQGNTVSVVSRLVSFIRAFNLGKFHRKSLPQADAPR